MARDITTIAFYDFDGTLVDTPEPVLGRKAWEARYFRPFPPVSWWSSWESLDTKVFKMQPIDWVAGNLHQDASDPDTMVILLTNRPPHLKKAVLNILRTLGLDLFDQYMFKTGQDKGAKILEVVDMFPDLETVVFYDDMGENIEFAERVRPALAARGVELEVYHV